MNAYINRSTKVLNGYHESPIRNTAAKEVVFEKNGKYWHVLVSYQTPVAAFDFNTGTLYRTSQFYSVTTSRHINEFIRACPTVLVGPVLTKQDFLDKLLEDN